MFLRKKNDPNILYNYEGAPFFDKKTNTWLIDFPDDVKTELYSILSDGKNGEIACSIIAQPNLTYNSVISLKKLCDMSGYTLFIMRTHGDPISKKITLEDEQFLFYQLSQLMTKHEDMSVFTKRIIVEITYRFLTTYSIDLIDELGDVFTYDVPRLRHFTELQYETPVNIFLVKKVFRDKKTTDRIFEIMRKIDHYDYLI